tara:strand:+ start:28 stop:1203 length:1176 start_codon:yes stop_codon:yes gene_type:complete
MPHIFTAQVISKSDVNSAISLANQLEAVAKSNTSTLLEPLERHAIYIAYKGTLWLEMKSSNSFKTSVAICEWLNEASSSLVWYGGGNTPVGFFESPPVSDWLPFAALNPTFKRLSKRFSMVPISVVTTPFEFSKVKLRAVRHDVTAPLDERERKILDLVTPKVGSEVQFFDLKNKKFNGQYGTVEFVEHDRLVVRVLQGVSAFTNDVERIRVKVENVKICVDRSVLEQAGMPAELPLVTVPPPPSSSRLDSYHSDLLSIFKKTILLVIKKNKAEKAVFAKQDSYFAEQTRLNEEEAARRAAVRLAAKKAKEAKEEAKGEAKPAFRAARLPPFPDVHANVPPSPRRVAEKEASLRAVEAVEAKKAEDRLRAQEEEEKKLLARRIGWQIGGGY